VKRRRRLRRLVPDPELLRRRTLGEPLRELACDYGVAHTTLGRYFARPEVKRQLRQAGRQLRAEQRALAARRSAERRLEQTVRRKATEQTAAERAQARQFRAAFAEWTSRRRPARSNYEAWLDERDAPRLPPTRADLHSQHDQTAAAVVSRGGGIQAVIDATDLRTLDNVARLIDPLIVTRAFDNDLLEQTQPSPLPLKRHRRLRRLVPDAQLLRRRAAGQPLRALACDYHVTHTTLSRYFARPEIKQQLKANLRPAPSAATNTRRSGPRRAAGSVTTHTSSSHTELR
jgi:hypothetical protein